MCDEHMSENVTPSKMTGLFFARKKILSASVPLVGSFLLFFSLHYLLPYIHLRIADFHTLYIPEDWIENVSNFLFGYCCIDMLRLLIVNRKILNIKYGDACSGSRCTCNNERLSRRLLFASHEIAYINATHGRLDITCPGCGKIIYCCNVDENVLFKCGLN